MTDLIIFYILGVFISSSWICTWFFSNFPVHLFKMTGIIRKKHEVFTWEDWSAWMSKKNEYIGELTSCPICFGFWTSAVVSTILFYINNLTPFFILASAFSWPLFIYIVYINLDKS
jgi:hypothetical protein|tara:strand:- start:475 stop:822 length:348 start_codon:yes stop_codon:yes gene_type:complete